MGLNARSCPSTVRLLLLDGGHIQASKTGFMRSSTHSSMKQKANEETFVESKIPGEHRGRVSDNGTAHQNGQEEAHVPWTNYSGWGFFMIAWALFSKHMSCWNG